MKHGVSKRAKGGKITIHTSEDEKYWRVIVEDDGVGFRQDEQKQDGRQHIGIENVRRRLESMCGGSLTVSSSPGAGAKVILSIPKGGAL